MREYFAFFIQGLLNKRFTNRENLCQFETTEPCHLERKESERCHMGNIDTEHFLISKPKYFLLENVKMRCFDMFKKFSFTAFFAESIWQIQAAAT